MHIEFQGTIQVSPNSTTVFSETLKYTSPLGIDVSLENHDKDNDIFVVKLTIQEADINKARSLAETEIFRLANLLSWRREAVILKSKISGYQYSEEKVTQNALVIMDTVHLLDTISTIVKLGPKSIESLKKALGKEIDDTPLDLMTLWRDALNQNSDITRFFLLYRILEGQLGNRKKADQWIIQKNPNIEQRKTKDGMVSIYTYLRDNIHPKKENPRFPFQEVVDNTPPLKTLIREFIIEKFPEVKVN